jgi:flagellar FliJ protein
MNRNKDERRQKEFETDLSRWRAVQIETMIVEFDRKCIDLGHQIEAEEMRARIYNPDHFAYPTYAKAARERRAKLQRSADALRGELDRLNIGANGATDRQSAAEAAMR